MATVRASVGPERSLAAAVGRRAGSVRRAKDGRWHSGISYAHESGLGRLLREAADAGSGLAVHAIGNGAVDAVLRAAESDPALAAAVPLRVEHAMAVDVDLARRLGGAGIPVVVQPAFLPAFGHELALMPLPDPLRLMPFRTLMSAGVTVAFSSDYPAAGLSPWTGIAAAVHRRDRTGRPIHPDEAIDLAAALDASTRGAASVLGVADAGTLEPGMRADMVWCDRDPYAVPTEELAGIVTFATWSGGRQVHGQEPAPTRP
jgi:predicted amidohydrolase YtcJ